MRRRSTNYRRQGVKRYRKDVNTVTNVSKVKSLSYQLAMSAVDPVVLGVNDAFSLFLTFQPAGFSNPSRLDLTNQVAHAVASLSPGPSTISFASLYSKCYLSKVIIKYFPAVTEGLTPLNNLPLSAANTITTVPIYDSIDNIMNKTKQTSVNSADELELVQRRPYTKIHSIYKTFTRVLKPTQFTQYNSYSTEAASNNYTKAKRWIDLNDNDTRVYGLLIGMRQFLTGGAFSPGAPTQIYPVASGEGFELGRLEVTMYTKYKIRI